MIVLDTTMAASGWDAAVSGFPDANAYQTSGWAEAKGRRTRAIRVLDREDGEVVGLAQLLIRRIVPGVTVATVPYGPLLAAGRRHDRTLADRLVERIEDEARRAGCSALILQPARHDTVTEPVLETRGYRPAPVAVGTTATLEVELGRPEDELFAGLTKTRRNNVRRSARRGVVVEQGGDDDLATFVRLHTASARRHGFLPMSVDYIERQWRALHHTGHLHLFQARVHGVVRAAGILLAFGPIAEFKLTGWDRSEEARTALANDAVNWAMMVWANEAGHRFFDVGGLPRDLAIAAADGDPRSVLAGTRSEFKYGWGGRVAVYPTAWEKVLRPRGMVAYRLPSAALADDGLGGRLVNLVRRT